MESAEPLSGKRPAALRRGGAAPARQSRPLRRRRAACVGAVLGYAKGSFAVQTAKGRSAPNGAAADKAPSALHGGAPGPLSRAGDCGDISPCGWLAAHEAASRYSMRSAW